MAPDVHESTSCTGKIMTGVFCVLVLMVVFNLSLAHKTLYTAEDPLVILNATTFAGTVYGTEHSWLVEFFASWCGHCIRFSDTWKQLAVSVKGKHP